MQNRSTWALVACITSLPVLAVSAMASPAVQSGASHVDMLDAKASDRGYDISRHRATYLASSVGMSDIRQIALDQGEWRFEGRMLDGRKIDVDISARNGRITDIEIR